MREVFLYFYGIWKGKRKIHLARPLTLPVIFLPLLLLWAPLPALQLEPLGKLLSFWSFWRSSIFNRKVCSVVGLAPVPSRTCFPVSARGDRLLLPFSPEDPAGSSSDPLGDGTGELGPAETCEMRSTRKTVSAETNQFIDSLGNNWWRH